MLVDAIKTNPKTAARTVAAVVISSIIGSALRGLDAGARDDDEDESYFEKWIAATVGNFAGNMNPLQMLPVVSQIFSTFEGYSVENSSFEVYSALADSLRDMLDADTDAERWAAGADIAGALSNFFGIPLANVMREVKAIMNVKDIIDRDLDTTSDGVAKAIWGEFPLLSKLLGVDFSVAGTINKAYGKFADGDTAGMTEVISELVTDYAERREAKYPNEKAAEREKKAKSSAKTQVTKYAKDMFSP